MLGPLGVRGWTRCGPLVAVAALPLLCACTRVARVHVSAAEVAAARDRVAHSQRLDLLTGDGLLPGGPSDVLRVDNDDGTHVTFPHRVTLAEALRSVHGGATLSVRQSDRTDASWTASTLTLTSLVLFGSTTPATIAGEAYQLLHDESLDNAIPTPKLGWYRSILVFEGVTLAATVIGATFWLISGLVFCHHTDLGEGHFLH